MRPDPHSLTAMSNINENDQAAAPSDVDPGGQPLTGRDTTAFSDPSADPAQAEWERTGEDPDAGVVPIDDEEVPATDRPTTGQQPETQGEDPVIAEMGEDGEGDLAPEDL